VRVERECDGREGEDSKRERERVSQLVPRIATSKAIRRCQELENQ